MKALPWILLALAVVALILVWFFKPAPVNPLSLEREQAYKTQQAITLSEKAKSDARAEYWKNKVVDTVKVVIVESEAKDKEIRLLRTRLAKSRPEIQYLIDSIKPLSVFVEQQDSLIKLQDEQIIVLRDGLYQVGKDLTSLIGEQEVNARIAANMLQQCEVRREEMKSEFEKENKKVRRKARLAVIGGIVGVVGALILSR